MGHLIRTQKYLAIFFSDQTPTKVHHEGINDEDGLGAELKLFQFFLTIEDKKKCLPLSDPIYPIAQ